MPVVAEECESKLCIPILDLLHVMDAMTHSHTLSFLQCDTHVPVHVALLLNMCALY